MLELKFTGSAQDVLDEMSAFLRLAAPVPAGPTLDEAALKTAASFPPSASDEPKIEPPAEKPKRGPGRPRKNTETASTEPPATPASTVAAEATPSLLVEGSNASASAASTSPEPAPEPTQTSDATGGAPALSLVDVKTALQDLMAAKDMAAATTILAGFGYTRVKDVKPEHYGAIVAKAKEAMA